MTKNKPHDNKGQILLNVEHPTNKIYILVCEKDTGFISQCYERPDTLNYVPTNNN